MGARPAIEIWTYDPALPSFRYRLAALVPELERRGADCRVEILPKRRYFRRILERRARLAETDVLVLGKIKLGLGEEPLLRRSARRIAFDFDDAIDLRRPRHPGLAPGRSFVRTLKFRRTCRFVDLVLAGNDDLAARARPFAPRVEIVPTSVDVARYPAAPPGGRAGRTLVWIGLPENVPYLEIVRPALARLAEEFPDLRLRVVSSTFPEWDDVPIERVPWSETAEVDALVSAGVGLMPLTDDAWTRGKCAFKLLQYMAAGLPCVGSAVGANRDAVVEGETGYLPRRREDWEAALRELLVSPGRRAEFGAAGRRRVEALYDRPVVVGGAADLVLGLIG